MEYSGNPALRGYQYQVVEALDTFVQMLEFPSRFTAYRLEPEFGRSVGDAAMITPTGTLHVKEIKYSSLDRVLTWRTLLGNNADRSLISQLYKAFHNLKGVTNDFTLSLVTNWRLGDDLRPYLSQEGSLVWERIEDEEILSSVVQAIGQGRSVTDFFRTLRIITDLPGPADWVTDIRARFMLLGGSELGWAQLQKNAYDWLFSGATVTEAMVRQAAKLDLRTEPTNAELASMMQRLQQEMAKFHLLQVETQKTAKETHLLVKDQGVVLSGQLQDMEWRLSQEIGATAVELSRKLSDAQKAIADGVVRAIADDIVPDSELKDILCNLKDYLLTVKDRQWADPVVGSGVQQLTHVYDDPRIEAKHRLKLIAPIIPGILLYERDVELKASANLGAVWDRLVAFVVSPRK